MAKFVEVVSTGGHFTVNVDSIAFIKRDERYLTIAFLTGGTIDINGTGQDRKAEVDAIHAKLTGIEPKTAVSGVETDKVAI